MAGKFPGGATRVAAITSIAIILTVSYAFLIGFGSLVPGQSSQGIIGNRGSQPGLITASTSTITETATSIVQILETTTLTTSYTLSNSFTSTTVVETTTITYTTTTKQTSTSCTGRCITLVATSPTDISKDGSVSFRAVDSIPSEANDEFTAFMNCGCNGGVVHGYFVNGVATFSVKFTLSGAQDVWVADGNQATNATTIVYSNSVAENVS
jgi:hypothetical protein